MSAPENTESPPQPPTPPSSRLWARWEQCSGIWEPFAEGAKLYVGIAFRNLKDGHLRNLYGPQGARDQAFAQWYKTLGHHFARYEATTDVPALVARAHGVVLELGPGTGNQFERFDAAKLTRVYGVEPNTAFAGAMAARLAATPGGLRDKYTPIFCGVEDGAELAKHGIVPGSLDCVLSMQVLCSVPKPREVARQLYDLLKPGGEILFWEHQRNEDWLGWAVQWCWSWAWPIVVGGCTLDRPIKDILLNAGKWEVVEVHTDHDPTLILPRVWGRLSKPKKHAVALVDA